MNQPRQYFTVESANATLPLVSRIVEDLVTMHPVWRQAVSAFELAQDSDNPGAESDEARQAREEAGRLAGEIESCMEELEQIGCLFRGFELGLVDFPTLRDGKVVVLCWQHGEESVSHWHELNAGFPGRQPVDAMFHAQETS